MLMSVRGSSRSPAGYLRAWHCKSLCFRMLVQCQEGKNRVCIITHSSLLAPRNPPRPIEIAPATSSASPPKMTTLVVPRLERPALRANGTVRPSESPNMASEMVRRSILNVLDFFSWRSSRVLWVEYRSDTVWLSKSNRGNSFRVT